jgi:hypothetical protein
MVRSRAGNSVASLAAGLARWTVVYWAERTVAYLAALTAASTAGTRADLMELWMVAWLAVPKALN